MTRVTLSVNRNNFERFDFLRWKTEKTTDEVLKELLDKAGVPNSTQCRSVRDRINLLKQGSEKDAALVEATEE